MSGVGDSDWLLFQHWGKVKSLKQKGKGKFYAIYAGPRQNKISNTLTFSHYCHIQVFCIGIVPLHLCNLNQKFMSTGTNFILEEVIEDLVNTEKSLVSPLMKLYYFAKRVKNNELTEFISKELNGYPNRSDLPAYRKVPGHLMVTLQAGYNTHEKPMPASILDPPFNEMFKYVYITEGIKAIETSIDQMRASKTGLDFAANIAMEFLHHLQPAARKLFRTDALVDVVGAKVIGNNNSLLQVVETVRAKLLDLVMDMGDKFGYNIEIASFQKDEQQNNQIINNYMKTEITNTGDGNIVNTGQGTTINATININKGDFESLRNKLLNEGVEEADIEELRTIVTEEEPDREGKKLGTRANGWIGGMFAKILGGATKIAQSAAGHLLADYIWHYYGH
jgi:hypothetical protein